MQFIACAAHGCTHECPLQSTSSAWVTACSKPAASLALCATCQPLTQLRQACTNISCHEHKLASCTADILTLLQSKEGCSGNSSLFKLRLTHLGDGSSLLAASWSHALTDGRLAELVKGQMVVEVVSQTQLSHVSHAPHCKQHTNILIVNGNQQCCPITQALLLC